ncbi:MAG: substrate binding domain-containing protein [Alphaproteobacteria bacterium]
MEGQCADVIRRVHVGSAVSGFLSEYGDLSVSLTLNDRFTDLIEEGFDVVIRISESADTSLIARRLGIIRCLMTATPDYLERMGVPTKPQDLSNHQCLSYIYLASGREWVMFGPNGATSVKVSGPLKANNGEMLVQVAREGLGIDLKPRISDGGLGPADPDWMLLRRRSSSLYWIRTS